jgi:hypothetical protein
MCIYTHSQPCACASLYDHYEWVSSPVVLMLEAPDFQDLCLALDPMLQADFGCVPTCLSICGLNSSAYMHLMSTSCILDIPNSYCLDLHMYHTPLLLFRNLLYVRPCVPHIYKSSMQAEVDNVNARRKKKVPWLLMRPCLFCIPSWWSFKTFPCAFSIF